MTDQELTYLYRTEQSRSAFQIIKHKYHSPLRYLTWNLVDKTFHDLPLETRDFDSTIYYSFMDCLRGYNIKQTKYSFIQALAIINRTRVIRYAGKFVSRNNSFSNGMVHLDQDVNIDHLPEFGQNEMFQLSNVLDRNEKVKAINRQLTNEVKNVRMIIGLKSRGYSNNEIGQRLSLTPKRVANYFSMFVKRFRILHPQLIDE